MRKIFCLLQVAVFFCFSMVSFASGYNNTILLRPSSPRKKPIVQQSTSLPEIWIGLKSGYSFNNAKDFDGDVIESKKTSTSDNIPFKIEVGHRINNKLSGAIAGIFVPNHNIKTVGKGVLDTPATGFLEPATLYLNGAVSSYGIMGKLNYELYSYNKFSQYIMAGAGVMYNTINNASFIVDFVNISGTKNRDIVFFNNNNFSFAWEVGTGVQYAVNQNLHLLLEYSYIDRGKAYTKDAFDRTGTFTSGGGILDRSNDRVESKLISHQILFGISFKV